MDNEAFIARVKEGNVVIPLLEEFKAGEYYRKKFNVYKRHLERVLKELEEHSMLDDPQTPSLDDPFDYLETTYPSPKPFDFEDM